MIVVESTYRHLNPVAVFGARFLPISCDAETKWKRAKDAAFMKQQVTNSGYIGIWSAKPNRHIVLSKLQKPNKEGMGTEEERK